MRDNLWQQLADRREANVQAAAIRLASDPRVPQGFAAEVLMACLLPPPTLTMTAPPAEDETTIAEGAP